MAFGAIGRDTQVRLMKCRALTFSVVMLPPQLPQLRLSVNGRPLRGLPAPSFRFWLTSTRAVRVVVASRSTFASELVWIAQVCPSRGRVDAAVVVVQGEHHRQLLPGERVIRPGPVVLHQQHRAVLGDLE